MRQVMIKCCVSCKRCKERCMECLRKIHGVKDVVYVEDKCRVSVTGDFRIDEVFRMIDCKFRKKFQVVSIEELSAPVPPVPVPVPVPVPKKEDKKQEPPKAQEEPQKDKEKDKEKPKEKEKEKPKEKDKCHHHHGPCQCHHHRPHEERDECLHDPEEFETPPKSPKSPRRMEPEYVPPVEPEYVPPTIIIHDSPPPPVTYSPPPVTYTFENVDRDVADTQRNPASDAFDLALLIGLVLVVVVLLSTIGSSRSGGSSMMEAVWTLVQGFISSTISTIGTLFLIVLALFAIMGVLCLADPRPRCKTC